MNTGMQLMMKCDMCYDRTSVGKKPMCASVCPSQALFYGTNEEIERMRPRSRPIDTFVFGGQTITTKVRLMVPRESTATQLDVVAALKPSSDASFDPMLSMLDDPDCAPDEVNA
jgi:Fe-S-cluster-containing dehydrogenase component